MTSWLALSTLRNTEGRLSAFAGLFLCALLVYPVFGQSADAVEKNQKAAIESLEAINAAEMRYATTFAHGFTRNLGALAGRTANPATASAAGLIDNDLSGGQKDGYDFVYTTSISGGRPGTYTVNANPVAGAGDGNFYFTDQSGVIRENKSRPATVNDPPLSIVTKLDPAIDEIVDADAQVEVLADVGLSHGSLTEGPVWVSKSAYLLFSDVPDNAIDRWTPDGKLSVFLKPSGYTGTGRSEAKLTHNGRAMVHLVGSVGITLDSRGRVVFCAQGDRAVVRLEKDGKRTILADRYEGKRLNSPNDLVFKSNGSLYFTDPASGFQQGVDDPRKELPYQGVFLLKDGKLRLLDKTFKVPNGLALTPDEKQLYVIDWVQGTILRFKILPDDTISDGETFVDMSPETKALNGRDTGAPDGMKVDRKGNVYCTGPGGLWVISPEGKHLGTIKTPKRLTNLAFGDADGKMLYMTTHTGELFRLHLKVEGIRP
jgi:sugar lactone lactonase YvrE